MLNERPAKVGETITVPVEEKIVTRVIVAGMTGDGPDFFFTEVCCTRNEYENGDHYVIAEELAEDADFNGPFVSFDEDDKAGKKLLKLYPEKYKK